MVSVKCLLGHYADPRLQTFNIVLMQKGKKQRLNKTKIHRKVMAATKQFKIILF